MCCGRITTVGVDDPAGLIDRIKRMDDDNAIAAYLERKPGSIVEKDEDDKTVLMWAVEKGRMSIIKKTVEGRVYMEGHDNDGWTAMMYAARRGNVDICMYLLDFGCDLNHQTTEDKFTALHLAAGNELISVCLALIKAGADPNMKDAEGKTAIDYLKEPRNKEKLRDTMEKTYAGGKTADQIHRLRVEAGTEKSVSLCMDRYGAKTVVGNVSPKGGAKLPPIADSSPGSFAKN
jgi:uncharacterized protein